MVLFTVWVLDYKRSQRFVFVSGDRLVMHWAIACSYCTNSIILILKNNFEKLKNRPCHKRDLVDLWNVQNMNSIGSYSLRFKRTCLFACSWKSLGADRIQHYCGDFKNEKDSNKWKKIKSLRYFSFKNGLNFKRNFSKYFESWIKGWDEAWGRDPCQKLSIFRNCLLPSNCIFSHWDFHACHKLRKPAMFYYNLST